MFNKDFEDTLRSHVQNWQDHRIACHLKEDGYGEATWASSEDRAISIMHMLVSQLGVEETRSGVLAMAEIDEPDSDIEAALDDLLVPDYEEE